ncbi:MAG: hypothetical protein WD942_09600 [Dehalococcoidia bacterium]
MPNEPTRRVYSTDGQHIEQAKSGGRVRSNDSRRGASTPDTKSEFPNDGFLRIRREKSGRGGKTVTAIYGVPGSERELDELLKLLKQRCGAGGTRDELKIEVQGDHRSRVEEALVALGYRVKQAGG